MLSGRKTIELLSPARDFECARAAILHGADAIYIGAPQFSARKVAANSEDDIRKTVELAHTYGCRVFVALNTVLFDHELEAARDIAWRMYEIGVDALIVQDMGLMEVGLPPIELHASTQMDNRTVEKVRFLEDCGFEQVVLARELQAEQIAEIAAKTKVRLECFVHGALCVSYSGQCYMSQAVNGRSANRGECAQPCRLKYDVLDSDGNMLVRQKHIMSLKDQNQSDNLELMIRSGASTLKIEGRLKDSAYVANVTLHYRRLLDAILAKDKSLCRASSGEVVSTFEPCVSKSFNRGFTTYFVNGRQDKINQPDTPKSIGEALGKITDIRKDSFRIATDEHINNGDGLCYKTKDGSYSGMRVNKAENGWIFPPRMPNDIARGTLIRRNLDVAFEAKIGEGKTQRLIDVRISLRQDGNSIVASCSDNDVTTEIRRPCPCEKANNPAASMSNIMRQMQKTGQTPYRVSDVLIDPQLAELFFAASELNALRRELTDTHTRRRIEHFSPERHEHKPTAHQYTQNHAGREANIVNQKAREFYERHMCHMDEWGYERQQNYSGHIVMTTKHCLMHSMGICLKKHPEKRKLLPLTLISENGKYEATTDCAKCEMTIRKK